MHAEIDKTQYPIPTCCPDCQLDGQAIYWRSHSLGNLNPDNFTAELYPYGDHYYAAKSIDNPGHCWARTSPEYSLGGGCARVMVENIPIAFTGFSYCSHDNSNSTIGFEVYGAGKMGYRLIPVEPTDDYRSTPTMGTLFKQLTPRQTDGTVKYYIHPDFISDL